MIVCPVCQGKQKVPSNFYNVTGTQEEAAIPVRCRTCWGTGIIEAFNQERIEQIYYDKINEETLTKLEERS